MKKLKPSLREKKRYLVYEIISDKRYSYGGVSKAILNESEKFLGRLGMANAGLNILNEWSGKRGILKVNNKYIDHIKATLTFINKIEDKKVMVKSVSVSGMLNKAKRYI
jgi:ribonuclease P/MRP protein subunit POP5